MPSAITVYEQHDIDALPSNRSTWDILPLSQGQIVEAIVISRTFPFSRTCTLFIHLNKLSSFDEQDPYAWAMGARFIIDRVDESNLKDVMIEAGRRWPWVQRLVAQAPLDTHCEAYTDVL